MTYSSRRLGVVGLGVALAACTMASAQEQPATTDTQVASTEVAIDADALVAGRRAAYFLSTQAVGQIKAGIDDGGDLRRTRAGAMMLANWAAALQGMFPAGSKTDGSRALDTVWSDREGFEAAAENYRAAAANLAEVAQSGDREAANTAFMAMAGTCHACHQTYRAE